MASEIRVSQINSRSGLSTVTLTETGVIIAGVTTISGSLNITGILTASSGILTYYGDGSNLTGIGATANVVTDSLVVSGVTTAIGGIVVGSSSSVTVGSAYIKDNAVGVGNTDTTGRNAGVGTAKGTLIYNESTSAIEYWDGIAWISLRQNITALTSGISSSTSTANVYTFYSTGTLTLAGATPTTTADVLIVGGGGGGSPSGGNAAGGGGAGGVIVATGVTMSSGTYTINIGAGGAAAANGNPSFILLPNSPPAFSSITSYGGGKGAGGPASPGGSGGGSGANIYGSTGSAGLGNRVTGSPTDVTRTQGNNGAVGGKPAPSYWYGGGGGGGTAAAPGTNGGAGSPTALSGISYSYGGGGGGGGANGNAGGTGGVGGGGPGGGGGPSGPGAGGNGTAGTTNLGGGGGGSAGYASFSGAAGGSGVIIISIPK